jgi:hypothetical protein
MVTAVLDSACDQGYERECNRYCRVEEEATMRARLPKDEYDKRWMERVKARCVIDPSGCWLWPGSKSEKGYGHTSYRTTTRAIHRQMYKITYAIELKTEQFVCHSCDVRHCCNPEHLWIGSTADNQQDSARKGRHQEIKKTHCPRGHAYADHARINPNGSRACIICQRARMRIKAGWPEAAAYSLSPVKAGYQPLKGDWKR